jgi:Holliday junction resolvase RusA-like endonuclease
MITLQNKKDLTGLKFDSKLTYAYVLEGDPIPLARARHGNRRTWDAQKHLKFCAGLQLKAQHSGPLLSGILALDVSFYFGVAKSTSQKKKNSLLGTYHYCRPDLDNLIKFVNDICNDVIFEDDCSVSLITARKLYDEFPRTEFTITTME